MALVIVAVAGAVYLRPSPALPGTPAAHQAAFSDDLLGGASFADANRGEVIVTRYPMRPAATPVHYTTSDAGRTWSQGGDLVYAPPMTIDWAAASGTARASAPTAA